jgi:DNA invertase Pin-like site-specific DNA recombinase
MVAAAVTRLQPAQAPEAAGYIRVSRKVQAEGHSPEIQREAIKRLALQEGYILTDDMIEEDHERGSKVTREGYQRIIKAVRDGRVHTVIVYMFDRWGRDGAEWLARAREFDRLGVPIVSVQEGKDEGGLLRFVRAGMAEEYSRQLAKRVLPAREKAAREGTHMGPTFFGYRRMYPEWDGRGRRPHGQLVVDEAEAWVVRELFARYDAGGWSTRLLASWLNDDPRVPPAPNGGRWTSDTVRRILRRPEYAGLVRYNVRHVGFYERGRPDSTFVVEGKHEPLIDKAMWDRVQRRMDQAGKRQTYNSRRPRIQLATGLLQCAGCGGLMFNNSRGQTNPNEHSRYVCITRDREASACHEAGYRTDVAHAALLSELRRLRGAPWTPQAEERLRGPDGKSEAERAAAISRALEQEREQMRKHTRRISMMDDDPTPEQVVAFREVSAEITARIRGLEAQLAELSVPGRSMATLRDLHEKLTRTELVQIVDDLVAQGDEAGLRDVILELVESACVTERRPAFRCTWARLDVTWVPDVRTLLDAGLLWLDGPAPAPHMPTAQERRRNYWRQKYGQGLRYRV